MTLLAISLALVISSFAFSGPIGWALVFASIGCLIAAWVKEDSQ